ncbi:hypothetical protein [Iodidimonas sp. SYSU 1G8]|uniref:hypothetical protein n=1 Tax=Iodidimonas sp. SYSU 1G8 TaxID=3133967 RepID=UPI0031FE7E8D
MKIGLLTALAGATLAAGLVARSKSSNNADAAPQTAPSKRTAPITGTAPQEGISPTSAADGAQVPPLH